MNRQERRKLERKYGVEYSMQKIGKECFDILREFDLVD